MNQEQNLLPDCTLGPFMYVAEIVCQASLPSFLTWVSLVIFWLEIVRSAQHHFHW